MAHRLSTILAASAGFGVLAMASSASAGGCNSGCAPPPPPPCCNVPRTHQVTVPGINITPPSVSIMSPSIAVSSASASASAYATASGSAFGQSQASSSGAIFATGGGSGFFVDQGNSGFIQNLNVESEQPRPICIRYSAVIKAVAIQASCLDDKAVPHPASQVTPDRDIADAYEGELFRCIAGARMQYTMAPWMGKSALEGGQTHACAKGEALYHTARGELVCRPQKGARDCNERSLLRRYGAGIKVVKAAASQVCAEWGGGTQTAAAGGALIVDGGVGGVVH